MDFLEQSTNLHVILVVKNAAKRIKISRWKIICKEVTRGEMEPLSSARTRKVLVREALDLRQVKNRRLELRIAFASSDAQVSRRSADIHHVVKAAEIEHLDDAGRCNLSEAVHAAEKVARCFFALKEVCEQRFTAAERLRPAVRALAYGVVQMGPELIQGTIRIDDVTRQGVRTRRHQIFFRHAG